MDDSKEEKKTHKVEAESAVEESSHFAPPSGASRDKEEPEEEKDRDEDEKIEENDQEEDDKVEEDDKNEEDEEEQTGEDEGEEDEDIRKSDVLRRDLNQFVRDNQPSYNLNPKGKRFSGKLVTLILFILTIAIIGSAIYFVAGVGSPKKQEQTVISPPTSTITPTPTPKTLNRSEWSFEVLNGSGVTGAAKKLADSLKALGYQVVRVANADKDYTKNEFFVQEDLMVNIDPIVADIKDIIKIASISGKLKDSTASARIIIGKE